MELNKHLEALAIREKSDTGNILPAYEVKRWPAGRLEELIELGKLIQIEDATSIKCPACSRGCSVEPVRGAANDGTEYCEVLCELEGSPDIDPFYLKQWQITEKIRAHLPKPARRKKKKVKESEKKFHPWAKPGDACFVTKDNKIMFHYNGELKNLRLKAESNTYRLIRLLAGGSLQADEIKTQISPATTNKACKIVDYANQLLNEKILKVGFIDVPKDVEFIKRDRFGSYSSNLKIHLKEDFDELQWQ